MSLNMAGNRGTLDGLPEGLDVMYLTDVQYAGAQAASFKGGKFMAIAGTRWNRDDNGRVILDGNGMPTYTTALEEIGNRESTFTGGFNNTLSWKGFSFNMLWEFRVGGDVINGTQYAMDAAGTSKFSGDVRNQTLTVSGVDANGNAVSNSWNANDTYMFSGKVTSGYNIIKQYYTNYYNKETLNYITDVNLLRLRSLSLSYNVPKTFLKKIGVIKAANVSVAANRDLLYRRANVLTGAAGEDDLQAAESGTYYTRVSSPTYLSTYAEACFIKAEVLYNQGNTSGAYDAYKEGIILTQKRIAMNFSVEIWNDMRRYDFNEDLFFGWGIPVLHDVTAAALKGIPAGKQFRRWRQCSHEFNYNAANLQAIGNEVPGANMSLDQWNQADDAWTINVWWDSDQQ